MKIKYEIMDTKDLTNITVSGKLNIEMIKEKIRTIYDNHNQLKKHNVLLDMRKVKGELNIYELYGLAKYFGPHLQKFLGKVAVIISKEKEFKRAIIMGLFLNNRGFHIRVFSNQAEAISWLCISVYNGKPNQV